MTLHPVPIATRDGGTLAWSDFGAPGVGEPIVLLAGQGVRRSSWNPVAEQLAATHRVLTVDHRGIGDSAEGQHPPLSTRAFAADVVRFLDGVGLKSVHIVGHSMGGRIAQWLAIDQPDRVATLTLIATTGGYERGVPRSDASTVALASGDPALLGPLFFGDAFLSAHSEALDAFVERTAGIRTRRRHFEASRTHDAWDELPRIGAPTLVVHGAVDLVTPVENARALAARIPDAVLIERADGRHGVHLEDPSVVDAVLAHVAEHPIR